MEETTAKKSKGFSFMKNVLLLMLSEIVVKVLGLVYRLVITNVEGTIMEHNKYSKLH